MAAAQLIVNAECFLSGASEELCTAIREQLTIDNPKYLDAQRYSRWVGKQLKPKLHFYRQEGQSLVFPRGFGNRAVLLCRRFMGEDPVLIDQRRKVAPINCDFLGELRPYQEEAVQAFAGHSFGVLEAGTGSGKTVMALKIIAERRQPTIILVHSRELLEQWMERIAAFLNIRAGQAGGGRYDPRPVTVAIVNTARNRLDDLVPRFGQLIVDECHRVPSTLFTDVVSGFDTYYMLGLSATAFRREMGMTKLIYSYMGDRVHAVDPGLLAETGAVVRPDLIQHETEFFAPYSGEYPKLIKALTKDPKRNQQIVEDVVAMIQQGNEGTILLVSDRVAHCQTLLNSLQQEGIIAEMLTGSISLNARADIVRRVQKGEVQVLLSTLQLISEGFDCPGLATLVLATPIRFEGRLLQVVGRIMRPAEGKKALVIDYVDGKVGVLLRSGLARADIFTRWQ
ncbi:MAG: DEAD/DEAH box helicase [Candidatus Electrothrix aestuarii]|uniref:DEAD/DEAH box helicase n=1 Tax=Candidatus Electrothrix aestuarii TaxID=3062594 RepID=A0AAU8LW79_9BACT|nr:DEAD/DEAH box helicase [Candidatus Electrothrix aestuarii]